MCIYCGTNKYRKIYENHSGPIPKDSAGRSYDIHHIDGNHSNNTPNNLMAISAQEHYDIHYSQGDWGACYFIAVQRLYLSKDQISELSNKSNSTRVANGTHNFLGGGLQRKRISEGTHNFLGGENQKKVIAMGKNPLVGGKLQKAENARRIREKTHNFLGSANNKIMLANGTHPSQKKIICHCGKTTSAGMHQRWHGSNCKSAPSNAN